jgi:hypothetical protein
MHARRALLAAATAILCVFFAIAASGAVSAGNLLIDPGAEQGGYGDWETANGFVIEQYGAANRPSAAVGASIGGGANVFAGGSEATVSTARQTVDVSSSASDIDAGTVAVTLSGYLGGLDDENDYAEVTAEYQGANAQALGQLKIGPVTAADRANKTALLSRMANGTVPAGTRRIRVTITATRVDGIYTDGYADNLSLVLTGAGSATATPAPSGTPTAGVTPAPTSAPPRKGSIKGIKSPGRRVKGKVTAKAPCKSGRKVVVKKGSKTIGKAKSKAGGKFTLKTKKHKKGKLTVTVRKRVIGSSVCKPVVKRVPGRN